jgi:hypothetical protein
MIADAINAPRFSTIGSTRTEEWGPSDHCRVLIDVE